MMDLTKFKDLKDRELFVDFGDPKRIGILGKSIGFYSVEAGISKGWSLVLQGILIIRITKVKVES